MTGKAGGLDLEVAPAGLVQRVRRQAPLRRPSPDPPPGKDQAENFLCLEDSQPRGPGREGIGSGDALASCIVFKAMKGTDEPATAYAPSRGGPQIGSQVRANGLGYADAAVLVTPDDDVLPHPGLLYELGLQYGLTGRDKVPALGKRGRNGAFAGSLRRVDIDQHSRPGLSG